MSVRTLLVAISEEQQVAKEAQGVSPPGGSISFGQGHRTTEPRLSLPSAGFYIFVTVIFLWYLIWCE